MTTTEGLLDLSLLNLATAASLARNAILTTLAANNDPWAPAAQLLRHLDALEHALRDYDEAGALQEASR